MNCHKFFCGVIIAILFIASVWAETETMPSLPFSMCVVDDEPRDPVRLGMAIEYFQSGKYHEALLIFEKLDLEYELNARYHAYMGVCCYYDWLYEEACRYLDEAIPQLDAFAPHERSVYYYCNGESHFQLHQYKEAIPFFERALTVCYENEKGDIHYRLGLCHMFAEEWQQAHDHYQSALDNYLTYRDTPDMRARIHQTAHMMKGCEEHLKNQKGGLTEADFGSAFAESNNQKDSINQIDMSNQQEIANEIESTLPTESAINLPTIPLLTADSIHISAPIIKPSIINNTTQVSNVVHKDTIRSEVPRTVNIQDIYNQKIDVAE